MLESLNDLWISYSSLDGTDWLAQTGIASLRTFTLVAARLGGMIFLLTFALGAKLARHLQILLVLTISLVITPAVVTLSPVATPQSIPETHWIWSLVVEFGLGAGIGLGVMLCLAAFQMMGELIDQQMGLKPQQILVTSEGTGQSITGQYLFLVGAMAFLTLPALGESQRGGLLLLVDTFLQSFQLVPVGCNHLPDSFGPVVISWVQHSIALALLVAAPILSCAMLVAMFVAVVSRSVPDANTMVIGFPLRTIVCLTVLLLTLSGITTRITQEIPIILNDFHSQFTAVEM